MGDFTASGPGSAGDDLTPIQREIIQAIEKSLQRRGYAPTQRETAEAVGRSTSSVCRQMSLLEAKGYLVREAGRPRTMTIRLPGQSSIGLKHRELPAGSTEVPLVGRIAAGTPIPIDEQVEDIVPLPTMLVGRGEDLVMLRVAGDSMIDAAIADRDWVVIRRQRTAENGEIVAAMIESDITSDVEMTVKTFRKTGGHIWLMPHNPAYSPIPGDNAEIIGKLLAVLRRV